MSNRQDYMSQKSDQNTKGIYIDLLDYFDTRQDKLFVVITPCPESHLGRQRPRLQHLAG
jgi:hypothetical protein